jgi:hypothetical protein
MFLFWPYVFVWISSFRVCGVVPWLGSDREIILLHTYSCTHIILPQNFTNSFYLHTTPFHIWPTLKIFVFIRGIWRYQTAGCLITGCWVVRFQVWHPWFILETLSFSYIAGWPWFFALAVPNQFRYPVWRQEPGSLMHNICRLLTEEQLFSLAYYYTVGTSFYRPVSVLLLIKLCIYNPSGICLWGFSISV